MLIPMTALVAVGRSNMYREFTMIDVKEVLRRWAAGQSNRKIALETNADRDTIARYVDAASELRLERTTELSDEIVHQVAQCVQSRPVRDPSTEWKEVAQHQERIAKWLEGGNGVRPLRLSKVHTLLVREHDLRASYDTLWRYAKRELGFHKKAPTVRLEDPPAGQEAQADFGKMGLIEDAETGARRVLWALIITLCFSRFQFVWPTFRQTTEAVCEGLDRAWQFFGGMVGVLIPDNTRAMIKDPDALAPALTASFLDYVQARGLFVDPARIRSPKDKARVENQVPYVRESWFDGEAFRRLEEARQSAEHWSREVAGTRVHGTIHKVPRELFESVEKPRMRPAPETRFDVPVWIDKAKVHPDHHIEALRALYSVPTLYLHKQVRARVDRTLVKIYFGTELIKVHARQPRGGRSTDPNDYPVGKADYALRSVDALAQKAREQGVHVGIYAEKLLGGPLPWTRMRQAYALLRLCNKYGSGRVEAICQSALAFDVVDVRRITGMLKTATRPGNPEPRGNKLVQLPLPRFARPGEHFETRPGSTKREDGR
jgi:transposase